MRLADGGAVKHLTASFVVAAIVPVLLGGCSSDPANPSNADADIATDVADDTSADTFVPPAARQAGELAARPAECEGSATIRCALPFPSNAFLDLDPTTTTGLRVSSERLPVGQGDSAAALARADGFSRLTPILTAFDGPLDPATIGLGETASLRLYAGTASAPQHVALGRFYLTGEDTDESLIIAYPSAPLAGGTEHVAVVTDALTYESGVAVERNRHSAVALGLESPTDATEWDVWAHFAPVRDLLVGADVPLESVVRVWNFTTRSRDNALADLRAVRDAHIEAVRSGAVDVSLDEVEVRDAGPVQAIVYGTVTGLPSFVSADAGLVRDPEGVPMAAGSTSAPFRIMLPRGTDDYRVVMYGHGTAGNVRDSAFDDLIADKNAMKVGFEFDGWTGSTVGENLGSLLTPVAGTDRIAARLGQSIATGNALFELLTDKLGSLLGEPTWTVNGDVVANPTAGRQPLMDQPMWAGGSLGGTMGLVFSYVEPRIVGGVLNVPGAGFSHWLPRSTLYPLFERALGETYSPPVDLNMAMALSQLVWDPVDGANWADPTSGQTFLVQMSVGDPILPNIGSRLVANAVKARLIGAALQPIDNLVPADTAVGESGYTQYWVDDTGPVDVHGFADKNTPAGVAARSQFIDFVASLWAGNPVITLPAACVDGACDFRSPE